MKRILSKVRNLITSSKGFTIIELLIVIAILGILATAVLSAINPVEQINRSRDTGTQSDAEQLLSAVQRFNASQGYFPWQTGAGDAVVGTGWTKVANAAVAPNGWTLDNAASAPAANPAVAGNNVLDVLGSSAVNASNELLNAYITRISAPTANPIYVYNGGQPGNSTYVCFKPKSQQFEKNATTRCATPPADYPAQACTAGSTTLNYTCLP